MKTIELEKILDSESTIYEEVLLFVCDNMEPSFCIHCGKKLEEGSEFCNSCGEPIF